jgi:predicted Rossmann fold flavoprotein
MTRTHDMVVIGGGAAGFFGAIRAAQCAKDQGRPVDIRLLEASSRFLQKVKISGGGRCNVTHHDFSIRDFVARYPRGQKEMISPMHQFQAKDMVQWLERHGVVLKTEADGRMFPVTDRSQTVIDCLMHQAQQNGVKTDLRVHVNDITYQNKIFSVGLGSQKIQARAVLLATGSAPMGYKLASRLGHHITPRAPSLFSFKIADPDLQAMQGIAFPQAKIHLHLPQKTFTQEGPLLLTHWGVSGPVILKLSAWAAREMMDQNYKARLEINWVNQPPQDVLAQLAALAKQFPKAAMQNHRLLNTTQRFWLYLLKKSEVDPQQQWAQLSKKQSQAICDLCTRQSLSIEGKNRFKDEFVECGGVDLREIDLKTMQSKKVPGLYFAGEVMDVDGLTGGFNLQHAWTSGFVAGSHMAQSIEDIR